MTVIGRLVGSGRSADIYEYGDDRVLRRGRSGPISQAEPAVMRAVRAAGYPVPQVYAVDGSDMVMDRIDGVDLLTHLTKRPWQARRVGAMLADLHRQLAAVPIGDIELTAVFGHPESFIHGDLHPGNVLLAASGPVVIDWEGAGIGLCDADTAGTWLLLETAEVDDVPRVVRPLVGLIRRTLLRAFLRGVDPPRAETVAAVCEARLRDTNMRPRELDRIREFASRHSV
jgi:aminoglycoside phosphotransferase (APT) family kinase protein